MGCVVSMEILGSKYKKRELIRYYTHQYTNTVKTIYQFILALTFSCIIGYWAAEAVFGFGGGCDGGLCGITTLFAIGVTLVLFILFSVIKAVLYITKRRR